MAESGGRTDGLREAAKALLVECDQRATPRGRVVEALRAALAVPPTECEQCATRMVTEADLRTLLEMSVNTHRSRDRVEEIAARHGLAVPPTNEGKQAVETLQAEAKQDGLSVADELEAAYCHIARSGVPPTNEGTVQMVATYAPLPEPQWEHGDGDGDTGETSVSVPPTQGPSEPSEEAVRVAFRTMYSRQPMIDPTGPILPPFDAGRFRELRMALGAAYTVDGLRVPPTEEEPRPPSLDNAKKWLVDYVRHNFRPRFDIETRDEDSLYETLTDCYIADVVRASVPGAGQQEPSDKAIVAGCQAFRDISDGRFGLGEKMVSAILRAAYAVDFPSGAGPAPQEETK